MNSNSEKQFAVELRQSENFTIRSSPDVCYLIANDIYSDLKIRISCIAWSITCVAKNWHSFGWDARLCKHIRLQFSLNVKYIVLKTLRGFSHNLILQVKSFTKKDWMDDPKLKKQIRYKKLQRKIFYLRKNICKLSKIPYFRYN